MNGWRVRCWCELGVVGNAGEASPYLKIFEDLAFHEIA